MPSGVRKQSSSKKLNSKYSSSATSSHSTTTSSNHSLYLGDREKSVIENWNAAVPKKSTRPGKIPEHEDPVVQAYLEAKLSLMKSAAASENHDARSVSSTRS